VATKGHIKDTYRQVSIPIMEMSSGRVRMTLPYNAMFLHVPCGRMVSREAWLRRLGNKPRKETGQRKSRAL